MSLSFYPILYSWPVQKQRAITSIGIVWLVFSVALAWKSIADSSSGPVPEPSSQTNSSSPTQSPIVPNTPTPFASPSETSLPLASPEPTTALENQGYTIKIPNKVLVDPRAKSALIPAIYISSFISSDNPTLVCIDSERISLSIQTTFNNAVDIVGNGTNHLLISGSSNDIMNAINTPSGSRAFNNGQGIGNTTLTIRTVALNNLSTDPTFCSQGDPSNTRILNFVPLDLALSITKSTVRVK
jgi:hypothetical protein